MESDITATKEKPKNKGGRPKGSKTSKEAKIKQRQKDAVSLYMKDVPQTQIAKALGCSLKTIERDLAKFKHIFKEIENVEDFDNNKEVLFKAAEVAFLKSMMSEEKLSEASLNALAASLKTVANHRRLETGKATSNVSVQVTHKASQAPSIDDYSRKS